MGGMDFSLKRNDRGISVFWLILAMGAGVFGLLAIVLIGTGHAVDEVERGGPALIAAGGEETLTGTGNTSAVETGNDPTFLDDTVGVGGPLPEGDVPAEAVEVEVAPGDPVAGAVVDPAERGTDADLDGAAASGELGEVEPSDLPVPVREALQPEVVTDPDGTTGAVTPTPSGPIGNDANPLTVD